MVLQTETLRYTTILRNTIFIDQKETDGQFEAVNRDVHGLRLDDTNTAGHNFFAASFSCGQVCVVKGARALVAQRWLPS